MERVCNYASASNVSFTFSFWKWVWWRFLAIALHCKYCLQCIQFWLNSMFIYILICWIMLHTLSECQICPCKKMYTPSWQQADVLVRDVSTVWCVFNKNSFRFILIIKLCFSSTCIKFIWYLFGTKTPQRDYLKVGKAKSSKKLPKVFLKWKKTLVLLKLHFLGTWFAGSNCIKI